MAFPTKSSTFLFLALALAGVSTSGANENAFIHQQGRFDGSTAVIVVAGKGLEDTELHVRCDFDCYSVFKASPISPEVLSHARSLGISADNRSKMFSFAAGEKYIGKSFSFYLKSNGQDLWHQNWAIHKKPEVLPVRQDTMKFIGTSSSEIAEESEIVGMRFTGTSSMNRGSAAGVIGAIILAVLLLGRPE